MHAVGLTWAKPQLLTSLGAASEWCSNMPATGHGVQLPSGKLLVPGYHLRKCTKIDAEVVEEAHAWLSDGGVGDARRWKISAGFGTGVAEESFVPLFQSPGQPPTVRATFRVDAPSSCNCTAMEGGAPPAHWPPPGGRNKCRRTATSTDEGLSWDHWWDQSSLPDPGCKGSYTRAEQVGAIIVGNNDDTRLRQNVTLSVSLDNGVTYPHKKTISGPGGYVDLTMVSDNLIGVLYEDGGCSIAMQTVDIRSILPPGHRGLKSDDRANAPLPEATRLRVEYLDSPLTIDTPRPRFSWALPAAVPRATVQASYRLVVSTAPAVAKPAAVWDSGVVRSNRTLNIPYGGGDGAPPLPLQSDTDYSWSVTWTDLHGSSSAASRGTFSIAILGDDPASPDWHAPAWVSSVANGSLSTYRAEFELEAAPVRARMYHVGLGYSKTWINGNLTDAHELGQYVTFQERVLYDCLDVARLLRSGKNVLGVMLGAGWFAQNSTAHGPRQFLVLLSVTMPDGKTTYFRSAIAGRDKTARDLVFRSTAGPEQSDNMYKGEDFDGESLDRTSAKHTNG